MYSVYKNTYKRQKYILTRFILLTISVLRNNILSLFSCCHCKAQELQNILEDANITGNMCGGNNSLTWDIYLLIGNCSRYYSRDSLVYF